MLRTKKYISWIVIVFSSLIGLSVLLVIIITKPPKKDTWKDFKSDLDINEVIIDAIQDGAVTYAITSKSGCRDYGDTLVVLRQEKSRDRKRIYENDFKNLRPWKIELADIDGDGTKEILTAVRKTTHYDKTEKNRMFIFNYSEGKLIKKWTGSEIAGIWKDFMAGDFVSIKGDELIFIRQTKDGERVSVYYWYNFGFLMLAESKDYKDILNITIPAENCIRMTYKKGEKEQTVILKAHNDKLVEAVK